MGTDIMVVRTVVRTERVQFETERGYFEISFDGTKITVRSVPHELVIEPNVSNKVTIRMVY